MGVKCLRSPKGRKGSTFSGIEGLSVQVKGCFSTALTV